MSHVGLGEIKVLLRGAGNIKKECQGEVTSTEDSIVKIVGEDAEKRRSYPDSNRGIGKLI